MTSNRKSWLFASILTAGIGLAQGGCGGEPSDILSAQRKSELEFSPSTLNLYEENGYDGDSVSIPFETLPNGVCINLTDYGFDDQTSSLRFNSHSYYANTRLRYYNGGGCTDKNSTEDAFIWFPGEVSNFSGSGFQNKISAVRMTSFDSSASPSKVYTITARHSGKCAGVPGYDNGAGVTQWECLGNEDQKWTLERVDYVYYYIKGKQSGKCLGVYGTERGTQATQWECLGNEDQKWGLVPDGSGHYAIFSKNSGLSLDVYSISTANGAPIVQWDYNLQSHQQWMLNPL